MNLSQEVEEEFWKKKFCINVKKLGDNTLYVEGYANPNTVDRVKERIRPKGWKLESFNKAGIILFNHDQNKPIGKPVDIAIKDGGLYIKARISGSKDPEISKIRDLIEEGILNTFSVGFKTLDEKRMQDGTTEITDAELFEVSVVSVPANADSLFSMSSKLLKTETCNGIIEEYLEMKHATSALSFREQLSKKNIDISEAKSLLAKAGNISDEIIEGLTSGDIEWKPDMYKLVEKTLGIKVKAEMPMEETEPVENEAADTEEVAAAKPSQEELDKFKEQWLAETAAASPDDSSVPAWVGNPELWAVSKQAAVDALGDPNYSFASSWYIANGGTTALEAAEELTEDSGKVSDETLVASEDEQKSVTEKSARRLNVKADGIVPAPTAAQQDNPVSVPVMAASASDTENNPYLDSSKQTNVLLGLVVNLLQTISSQMEMNQTGQPKQGLELPPAPSSEIPLGTDAVKNMAVLEGYLSKLDSRIKSILA